jgi:hypothetical protein
MNLKELLSRYSVDQLKEAIRLRSTLGRVEALTAKREALLKQVAGIDRKLSKLNAADSAVAAGKPRRRRWKLSAETRRKMSEAATRRYASKDKAEEVTASASPRKRRSLSSESRQKMAEAARRRWAKVKGNAPVPAE